MKVTLNTDGGVRTGGKNGPTGGRTGRASIGFVIRDENGTVLRKAGMEIGEATVSESEYSALISGLYNAHSLGATEVQVLSDSMLVVNQMTGRWAVREPRIREYVAEALGEAEKFTNVSYKWIPRKKNAMADALAAEALDGPE